MPFDVPAPAPYTMEPKQRSNQRHRIITAADGSRWYLNKYGVVTGTAVQDILPGWGQTTFPAWRDGVAIRDFAVANDPTYKVIPE